MANESGSSWVKWVVVVALLAACAGGALWYLTHRGQAPPEYQSAKVARGDLTQAVTASGTLNPVLNVQVGSQISGNILRLCVDFNSPVTNGQLIAQLDPATYQANVSSAEGDLANATAALELAQINARRAEELFKNKLIAQSDFDQSVASLHQAEAQVKVRTAALERAKVDFARCKIYAPVDGIVISRNVDVGQTVAASLSAPTLYVIANDLTKMQIDANVAEADVGGVEEGQDVNFTVDAFPYRTFRGKVTQVRNAPIIVQNVVTYDTVIGVNNPDYKLKPGMTANVSIVIQQRTNVLKIPNAALRFRPPAAAGGTNAVAQATTQGPRPEGPGGAGFGGGGERRRGGPGGGGFGGGPGGRPRGERPVARTVYVLASESGTNSPSSGLGLKPVQITTGISDGVSTEVRGGLNEDDIVVTGVTVVEPTTTQRPTNPFGGGPRRF